MRKLFCLFGLLAISLSASAAGEWFYYKHYPWVYDNVSKDWLYLRGSSDGEIYAYRSSTKEWEVFEVQKTWEEKYEEWILDPEPYGGLDVLQMIKYSKDSGGKAIILGYSNITDIDPLAELTNLFSLVLMHNNITNTTPLAGLTNLTVLSLDENNITDLTPLAGLTNLTGLYLGGNNISDLTPLAGLTNLTKLYLSGNSISDLTPLAGLKNLTELFLSGNSISDLTPLAGLKNLTELFLDDNNITGVTYLSENPITASQKAMLEKALPNTTIYWPDVIIDDSVETEKTWDELYEEWILNPEPYGGLEVLQKIKEAKETGANWPLLELDLSFSRITDISPLAGLTNLTSLHLTLSGNNISDITPLAGLTNLEGLDVSNASITDISPLAGLTNLEWLGLGFNNISDLTPLAELTNLEVLSLWANYISDLSPLAGLTNLTNLDLGVNYISASQKAMLEEALPNTNITWPDDIYDSQETEKTWDEQFEVWIQNPEPYGGRNVLHYIKRAKISGATGLKFYLNDKSITDITPLAGLTNLEVLDLRNNNITDISLLAGLTNLTELDLSFSSITDISPLAGLTNLEWLTLGGNNITDITPLAGLTNLEWLDVSNASITDISPLAGLTNLEWLIIGDNNITASQKAMLEAVLPNTSIVW